MKSPRLPKALKDMRTAGIIEGWSYIVLLFVAMPLKYFAELPIAVRVTGTVHGVLFIMFMYTIYNAMQQEKFPMDKAIKVFIASIIPFGTFFLDKLVLKEYEN
jgi:integral membrane protein